MGRASQTCGGTPLAASQSVAGRREGWRGAVASASPPSAARQPGCTAPLGALPHTHSLPRALARLLAARSPRDVPSSAAALQLATDSVTAPGSLLAIA
eukprot:110361-Prymnesium_polylepis.1